jgi:hypothetical protein
MRLSSCGRKSRFRTNRNLGSKAGTHAMSWVGYAAAEFAPVVACAHKAAILVLRPTAIISGAEIPQAQQPPITSTCAILSIGSTGGDGNALFRQNDSCLTEGPAGLPAR